MLHWLQGNKRVTAQAIVRAELVIPLHVSMECSHFITSALSKDPGKRPTIDQLLEHPFILAHMKAAPHKTRGLVLRAGKSRWQDVEGEGRAGAHCQCQLLQTAVQMHVCLHGKRAAVG
jgi:serine/threonine protein kinase